MKLIIQCAATKISSAGTLRTQTGALVEFVAHPENAPQRDGCVFVRPDDESDVKGKSWRQVVDLRNRDTSCENDLFEAYRLYTNPAYAALVERFGVGNVFVLSAGWGLVRANFRLPRYDITFSKSRKVPPYKRRELKDPSFKDYCQLNAGQGERVLLLAGTEYLPLFRRLTEAMALAVTVFYASATAPRHRSWQSVEFPTRDKYRWVYNCAVGLCEGNVPLTAS